MSLALWLFALPFRLLGVLGLRGTITVVCLFVLAVTSYGVAVDLGLVEPIDGPAHAAPAKRRPAARQPEPSRTARADIPTSYLPIHVLRRHGVTRLAHALPRPAPGPPPIVLRPGAPWASPSVEGNPAQLTRPFALVSRWPGHTLAPIHWTWNEPERFRGNPSSPPLAPWSRAGSGSDRGRQAMPQAEAAAGASRPPPRPSHR